MRTFAQKPTLDRRLAPTRGAHGPDKSDIITAPSLVHDVLARPGDTLDSATRAYMEPRFGHDFSNVRVHTGSLAGDSAQSVGANAYTVGRSIVFGSDRYAPNQEAGRRLIAHELTHVLQQRETPNVPRRLGVSTPGDAPELQADRLADAAISSPHPLPHAAQVSASAPMVQREPTKPRTASGTESIADLTAQTAGASGKASAGSLSKMEWESLFRRHFAEPDKVEDEVESSHARYLYSNVYGWIDAQHFFAHIQFAEELGLAGATAKGIDIETNQARVRGMIGPDPDDTSIYSDLLVNNLITPADLLWYLEGTFMLISAGMDMILTAQEKALLKGFSDEQLAKTILDNAMSAWSYEDLVSNQLGVQFFRLHGAFVNAGTDAADVRARFISRMTDFFTSIQIVNDSAAVKAKSRKLPGKERWTSKKLGLADAKKKHPELFAFGAGTHRLRAMIHDSEKGAADAKRHIESVAPSAPGLHVEKLGSKYAVYTGAMSHFEAIVMRALLSKAIPIKSKAVIVEPVSAAVAPQQPPAP